MRNPRTMLTAAIAAVLVATSLAVATPAQAALPTCTIKAQVASRYPGTYVFVPAVPGNYSPSIGCQLKRGNKSEAVKVLQKSMSNILNRYIDPDGDFGPITQQALRDVQRIYGISIDGEYGPQSRQAICWLTVQDNACDWLR